MIKIKLGKKNMREKNGRVCEQYIIGHTDIDSKICGNH